MHLNIDPSKSEHSPDEKEALGHNEMLFSPPLWSLFVLLAAVLCGSVAPGQDPFPSVGPLLDNPFGFETTNKKARCFEGSIPVFVNTTNTHLLLDPSPSQPDVTEIFQELFQVNSDIVVRNSAGAYIVTGNFNIATTLCYPESSNSTTSPATVQVLGHGVGLDRSYWDISPSNSYVEAAAEAGYATLAFDRLGVGDSDKPDPINVVQANVHVEVLFNLAKGLRNGQIGLKPFKNVVGVGSSFGGIVQIGANAKYPTAFDAVVISSVSDTLQYLPYTIYSNTPARARDEPSGRFSKLPGAYLVDPTEISFQQPFFRYPFYDQSGKPAVGNCTDTLSVKVHLLTFL